MALEKEVIVMALEKNFFNQYFVSLGKATKKSKWLKITITKEEHDKIKKMWGF